MPDTMKFEDVLHGLQKGPGKEFFKASAALRGMAAKATGDGRGALVHLATAPAGAGCEFRRGVLNVLGHRQGPGVAETLIEAAKDADPVIRATAAAALANHPSAGHDRVIQESVKPADACHCHADPRTLRIRLAATLAKAGNTAAAQKIFEAVGHRPRTKGAAAQTAQR